MRSSTGSLLPVLAALAALVVLGMPEGVAAQCTMCESPGDNLFGGPRCVPLKEGKGYEECEVVAGEDNCTLSSDKPDCGLVLALDGRALDLGSGVATGAVAGAGIPRWLQLVVPAPETPPAALRQACTGAIVQRLYSPGGIAQLRSGLRHVTI